MLEMVSLEGLQLPLGAGIFNPNYRRFVGSDRIVLKIKETGRQFVKGRFRSYDCYH